MKHFPDFLKGEVNKVKGAPHEAMQGFVFEGRDGVQIVFWECEVGGEQPEQVHDFWEYAMVVEGEWDGWVDDQEVHLKAGDELVIPPGAKHRGRYSDNYRAIDAFSAHRLDYLASE